jgi:hypothetical protein
VHLKKPQNKYRLVSGTIFLVGMARSMAENIEKASFYIQQQTLWWK